MTLPRTVAALAAALLLPVIASAQGANAKPDPKSPTADQLPVYVIDPTWPPTLPNDWILGDIRGLFVDDRDHLWVIHMPSSLTDQELGAAAPTSFTFERPRCDRVVAAVLAHIS